MHRIRNLVLVVLMAVTLAFGGLMVTKPEPASAHTYVYYISCTYQRIGIATHYGGSWAHYILPIRGMSFYEYNAYCW